MHGTDDVNRQTNNTANAGGTQGPDVAERLFNLFVGNERRHVIGSGLPVFDKAKNKWSLTSTTHDGPATLDHWQQHLDHKFILSIIPLLDNGTCGFACIDADEYEIDYVEICERIDKLKLPFIAVVSKSAGLHIFVFFKEAVSAKLIIPILKYWATRLGLKKFEIFQTNDGTFGNFSRAVAMPYGGTWNALAEQNALNSGRQRHVAGYFPRYSQTDFADELPEIPKESQQQQSSRQIPLYLQAAINSFVPYQCEKQLLLEPHLLHLVSFGFDQIANFTQRSGTEGPSLDTTRSPAGLEEDVRRSP